MSLEDQIRNALRSNSFFKPAHVNEFLDHSRFLHVYGKIRDISSDFTPLPSLKRSTGYIDPVFAYRDYIDDLQYRVRCHPLRPAREVAARICSRKSRGLRRCVWRGDRRNCDSLDLTRRTFGPPPEICRKVYFTNFENGNRVNKAASKAFRKLRRCKPTGKTLAHPTGPLGPHEKSIRDCYGAPMLAGDDRCARTGREKGATKRSLPLPDPSSSSRSAAWFRPG